MAAAYRKYTKERHVLQYYDTRTGDVVPMVETSLRFAVLEFLDELDPADVYSICEVVSPCNSDKEIIIYFREKESLHV